MTDTEQKIRADAEKHARLMGIVAALGLPQVRTPSGEYRKRLVEIELTPGGDNWQRVDGVSITAGAITFFSKPRAEWRFSTAEGCPAWRVDHGRDQQHNRLGSS